MEEVRCGREGSSEPIPNPLKPNDEEEEETPSEDRFNALPESLLIHIVSFLPLLDAISLSTVSKRWQYLWTMIANLIFDQPYRGEKFVAFVNQTLALRRSSKIYRFSLPLYTSVPTSTIDQWIDFAIKSNVEDFELRVDEPDESYALPEQIYTLSSLRKLRLEYASVAPIGLINWKSLKSLYMRGIMLSDQVLENLLIGCPVLEFLEMRLVDGFKNLHSKSLKELVLDCYGHIDVEGVSGLEIVLPNVQSVTIRDYQGVNLPLLNAPLLVDAQFDFKTPYCNHGNGDCLQNHKRSLQLFENFHHVETLGIGAWLTQVMSMWRVKEFPSPLLNCKYLSLEAGVSEWEIPGILNLLRSAPHLETLYLFFVKSRRYCRSSTFEGEDYAALEKPIALDNLKSVLVAMNKEQLDECDLKLLQFVLKNAKVLEAMCLSPDGVSSLAKVSKSYDPEDLGESMKFLEGAAKLFASPRSSPNALVLFGCKDYIYTPSGLTVLHKNS